MPTSFDQRLDARVAVMTQAEYGSGKDAERTAFATLERASKALGWFDDRRGPFGNVIAKGSRVVVKPNLVNHVNHSGAGLEPVVSHPSFVQAAVRAALLCEPAAVVVGDAPIQGCDFPALMEATGLGEWARRLQRDQPLFQGIRDFRRTTCVMVDGVRVASEELIGRDRYSLFDLGRDSLLEPVTQPGRFRVTCYDPRMLEATHRPGHHQYLISRDVLEADTIINVPKLKMHMKAGVTNALKNLVGINGNKEYLPHHRRGGAADGGDCYPGRSWLKAAIEWLADVQNTTPRTATRRVTARAAALLSLACAASGDHVGVEGSWSGNDTVWRMCLDLNRILLYGRPDGTMARAAQRRVLHFSDAVTAGQGNGPLAPVPLPLGIALVGSAAPAIDQVGARLLGLDPLLVPLVRESFDIENRPLVAFGSGDVVTVGDLRELDVRAVHARRGITHLQHPVGWRTCVAPGSPRVHVDMPSVARDSGTE